MSIAPSPRSSPSSLLVILPTWVGDFVMATPTLRAVRTRFADAHIVFFIEPNLVGLLGGGDWMDEWVCRPERRGRGVLSGAYRGFVRGLRQRRIEWALVLPNSFRAALLAWHSGARRRFGYARDGRGFLLTDRVRPRNREGRSYTPMPLVTYYAELAEAMGCERPGDDLELFTTPEEDAAVEQHLRTRGVDADRPLVVIAPGAKYGAAKLWVPERFAETADRLMEMTGASVLITCGPGEEPLARRIGKLVRRGAVVFDDPRLTLGELKSLVRRGDLLLCNDAGPRHIAKAFGVPVVTVFGPTHPEWTATSHPHERIVRIEVECGPCQQKICPLGHHQCMEGVTVDAVTAACLELLNARHGATR
jgi:heptosyltransferase-2